MTFRRQGGYRGPVRAAIFDWAGTIVDHGSFAPVEALIESFRSFGVVIDEPCARGPMGIGKRDHIRAIAASSDVSRQWQRLHSRAFTDDDAEQVYAGYLRCQPDTAAANAQIIDGSLPVLHQLQQRGLKIGSTTGYPRVVVDALLPAAAKFGFHPATVVCDDDVASGRPAPYMALECMRRLAIWPVSACIKIDDTAPGIQAGVNAGMWTVGVTLTGNYAAMRAEHLARADANRLRALHNAARNQLRRSGAHFIIRSVADLMPVVEAIAQRLRRGERP